MTSSAACILTYWWLMPTLLYLMMRWRKNQVENQAESQVDYKFLELLCLYGYSLAIYIPISLLWTINISFLQWTFTSVAVLLSGGVLVINLLPAFSHDSNKKVILFLSSRVEFAFIILTFKNVQKVVYSIMAMVIVFHALLGVGFMVNTK